MKKKTHRTQTEQERGRGRETKREGERSRKILLIIERNLALKETVSAALNEKIDKKKKHRKDTREFFEEKN